MPITLFPEQVKDLELLRKHKYYALWHEVGSGKTFPLIFRMLEGLEKEPHRMWIVVMEVHLLDQWKDEIALALDGREFQPTVSILTGDDPKWKREHTFIRPPNILLINYEFFPKVDFQITLMAKEGRVGGIICDEAHRLKGFRGFRSKRGGRAQSIVSAAHANLGIETDICRYMASGSPVVNPNSVDLWGLYYFLNPSIFGNVLWKFENEFFYNAAPPGIPFKKLVLRPEMREEMSRRMYLCARRLLKEETGLEFPEVRPIVYKVDMPPDLEKAYNQMREDCFLFHDGVEVTRLVLLARLMALAQLSSGFILENIQQDFNPTLLLDPAGDTGERVPIHINSSHKDNCMWSIIDEVGREKSMVIWAHFRHELEHVANMLESEGMRVARVWGDEGRADKRQAIADFKAGKRTHMVAQPASAGAGLNLQIAGYSLRYSRSHRLLDFIQSNGRINRATSVQYHKYVTYFEIVARHTYDEYIYNNLKGKFDLSSLITLDAFKEMRLAS
jgi:SNF2 family DNA or RNA helicase